MLQELTIRNFALLEEVRLTCGAGLNVLTGETGAGKSIIIDAIGAVLGGRIATDAIRTGAERATVEAIFDLSTGQSLDQGDQAGAAATDAPPYGSTCPPPSTVDVETASSPGDAPPDASSRPSGPRALLDELGLLDTLDDDGPGAVLILARELSRAGRSVARVNGRAVPVSTLAQLGAHLVDIHGQHEHLSLLRPGAQRDLLDRFGGLMGQRRALAALVRDLRAAQAELRALQTDEREVARRIDLLSFQIEEIQSAKLTPGEEEALVHERTLLANAARLAELAAAIRAALAGAAGDEPSALDLLGRAARDLAQLVRIDPQMAAQEQLLAEATAQVEELGRTLRAYGEAIEFAPERLEQVSERLHLLRNLQRKYGQTVEEVLAFGGRAAAELDALANREARSAALDERAAALEQQIAAAAAALSSARAAAGERLAAAVGDELRALGLRGRFEVALLREAHPEGLPLDAARPAARVRFDETGIDTVDFRFAPNPGEPPKSVARTASGGELSRVLLALKAVLSAADRTPTLIFDEVDAGIGGRNGQVVGEKLAQLAHRHQVLCVTHLPQIAAYGDTHFYIAKEVRAGRTATTVAALDSAGSAQELAQMLGGATATTLDQARQLLARAEEWKRSFRRNQDLPRGTPEAQRGEGQSPPDQSPLDARAPGGPQSERRSRERQPRPRREPPGQPPGAPAGTGRQRLLQGANR